jgi:hypothetical protein
VTPEYHAALRLVADAARETTQRPHERPRAARLAVASEGEAAAIVREADHVLQAFAFNVDELRAAAAPTGTWIVRLRLRRTPRIGDRFAARQRP